MKEKVENAIKNISFNVQDGQMEYPAFPYPPVCFDDVGVINGVSQKDWHKITKLVLEKDRTFPLKEMLLQSKH